MNSKEIILIVDDFDTNIQILIEILGEDNYQFLTAEDGEKAIDILKIHHVDLVLLDIFMPHVSGYEVCEFIKSDPSLKEIPVIFITTLHGEEGVIKGFELGAQDYITKPFKNGELIARVKTQIELKRNREILKNTNEELELKVREKTAELNEAVDNLKLTLRQLEKAHEELVELDRTKMQFLKIISHEMKTPLNGILGFSKLLADSDMEHKYKASIHLINESAIRLEEFSNDALLISQLSLGNYSLNPEEFNIHEVVNQIELSFHSEPYQRFTLINEISSDLYLNFDKHLFEQCLRHIIDNAIAHGGENVKIRVSGILTADDTLQLTISDNGRGFSEKLIKQGIKLFMSERHVDKNPGLGLALTELIMKQNGGSLHLKNGADGGAMVFLSFPLT